LDYLDSISLSFQPDDVFMKTFLNYCLPTLQNQFKKLLLTQIPEHHKKAIIASHLSASLVYRKGLQWWPTIIDILPLLLDEQETLNEKERG
jgi:glutamate dehydrogenase